VGRPRHVLKWMRGVDWINLAQDRDRCCEHGHEHVGYIKFGEFLDQLRTVCL
jgi:hypothetical protein